MKPILVAIPSKNRADILANNTWKWAKLLDPMKYEVVIFVEPQDFDIYSEALSAVGDQFWMYMLYDNDKGLGFAKDTIKKYAHQRSYELVFKVDDDITGFSDFRTKRTPEQTAEWFNEKFYDQMLKTFAGFPDLGAVAFPYSFQMFDEQEFVTTKRVQTAYLCRPEFVNYSPDIHVFEDFAVGLHILTSNKKILLYKQAGIQMGVKVGGGTGGHQSFDRKAQAYKEIELLRAIYPPLKFKKVAKPWEVEPDLRSVKL